MIKENENENPCILTKISVFLDTVLEVGIVFTFRLCGGGLNSSVGQSVCRSDKKKCNKIKYTLFYVDQQSPTSTGLCPDARISTNLIHSLQLVLCVMRLPLYP